TPAYAPVAGVRLGTGVAVVARETVPFGDVRGAGIAHAVAALLHVAAVGRRPAGIRALAVLRTGGVRARAMLGAVARPGGGATDDAGRQEGVGGAIVAEPVTALLAVARPGGGATHVGALVVRRAGGARPGAVLGQVAGPGGGTAHDRRRGEGVGRAVVA